MPEFHFERESRTPYSEAWTVEDGGDPVGRVDLHFTASGTVYATLACRRSSMTTTCRI